MADTYSFVKRKSHNSTQPNIEAKKYRKVGPKPELTKRHYDDLALAFGQFDPRGVGTVPSRTLLLATRAMGKDIDSVDEMIERAGYPPDEDIDFKRFHQIMQQDMLEDMGGLEVEMAFTLMSSDKNWITVDDLKNVAEELGSDLTEDEITEMVKFADLNSRGKVSLHHFKKILERPLLE